MRIKDIVIIGMLSSLLIAVQVILAFLPNIELVSLLIILFTLLYKRKALFIIFVFVLLEGFIYGFGLWWLNYIYIWFVLYFITRIFKKEQSPFFWAVISGIFGLTFGAICSILYLFMGWFNGNLITGFHSAIAYWITGIPFDIAHGISNFFIALFLFKPIYYVLNIVVTKDI
jgi:energy-coupling factor transport system substrate-specific component